MKYNWKKDLETMSVVNTLTKTQSKILHEVEKGNNVFLTGPGGCGKSYIINKICEKLNERGLKTVVTATTGCAAVLLGNNAKTLNSWSGVGLADKAQEVIVGNIMRNQYIKKRWLEADVLIIDEVSMLSQHLFDLLNEIGKVVRKSTKAFGGLQIIASGDFYQLPPIGNDVCINSKRFCFESENWVETFEDNQICLKKVFRQDGDECFKKILNQIRKGEITEETCQILNSCIGKLNNSEIEPVKLYPRKNSVDKINNDYNNHLETKSNEYHLEMFEITNVKGYPVTRLKLTNKDIMDKVMKSSLSTKEKLVLKVGSQVMCIVNLDMEHIDPICNGSCGVIIGFDANALPIVRFYNGRTMEIGKYVRLIEFENGKKYELSMIPLILCWAMSIHKSQGCSLDIAEIDIGSGVFECGQSYVALSRVRSLGGLFLKSFDVTKIKIKAKVKSFYENLAVKSKQNKAI